MKFSKTILSLTPAVGLLGFISTAYATDTDLQASADTMIFATGGPSMFTDTMFAAGAAPGLFAGADATPESKRSLLKFDLTTLNGQMASGAVLTLTIGQIAATGAMGCQIADCTYPDRYFAIYPSTTAWTEGHQGNIFCGGSPCATFSGTGHGWDFSCTGKSSAPCLNAATWKHYDYDGNPANHKWGNADTDQDYGYISQGTAMATGEIHANFAAGDPVVFGTTMGFVAVVQSWISNSANNKGLELRSTNLETSSQSFLGFWSKDGAAAVPNSLFPVLTVTH